MSLLEDKKALRMETAQKLAGYSMEWIREESRKIERRVLASEKYKQAEVIFCYVSFGKEVQTQKILADALMSGKKVGVPLCMSKGIMEVRRIDSLDDLHPGAYGILEPKLDTEVIKKEEIQYGIIPCVTCDHRGNRMGHGAGYYDRYLENSKIWKTILCFNEIMAEEVPVSELDVTMNQVMTQTESIILS